MQGTKETQVAATTKTNNARREEYVAPEVNIYEAMCSKQKCRA
jgi:hypothetical protein